VSFLRFYCNNGVLKVSTSRSVDAIPQSSCVYSSTRIALYKFHALLLSKLQLDPSSSSFHARLLKHALTSVSLVLDTKTPVLRSASDVDTAGDAVSKKGKKRARGAADDVVVAGIEGRGGRGLSRSEGLEVINALKRESSFS
jgi:hypothetical protein